MSDAGKNSVRRSIKGADRGLRVIDGGGGPPRARDGGDDACPVTALGHLDGNFWFLDACGQVRKLSARALGARQDLLSLFGGRDEWLRAQHPKKIETQETDADGRRIWKTVDFKITEAASALQRACFEAGLYGEHIVLRRAGVWRGEDGAPVVHCGDAVLVGTAWHAPGARSGGQVWTAAAPVKRPDTPCPAAIGRELQDGLTRLWNWREVGSPVAVLGLIATAYYGAALDWRPAGFVTGDTGGGKSSLLAVMRGALPLHHYSNDSSKAGIEQAVHGRAMPILIDESSDRADTRGARQLVDLVLSATGGEGTRGTRGTADGIGRTIELVGSVIMFSINTPEMEPQHLGRFTLIDLRAPDAGEDHSVAHAALAAFARAHGRQLWGRALAGWDRYCAALVAFRAALVAGGCKPREADQSGALLAGWWVLTHEGLPDGAGVREGIGAIEGHVRRSAAVEADSRPRRCAQHLLYSMITLARSTEREPLGKVLDVAYGSQDYGTRSAEDARELLTHYGIRVVRACSGDGSLAPLAECTCPACREPNPPYRPVPRRSREAGIWLANGSPELRRLFANTPYEGDRWRAELLRLGATASGRSVRIGSVAGHALWLTRSVLIDDGPPDG